MTAKTAAQTAADTEFRDSVAKAAEKRAKTLEKLPAGPGTNVAEAAWNATKADDDPAYGACDGLHREKLNYAAQSIKESGSAGIQGLEAFEARVKELLAEQKGPVVETALVTTDDKKGK